MTTTLAAMAATYRIMGWTYAGVCALLAMGAHPGPPRRAPRAQVERVREAQRMLEESMQPPPSAMVDAATWFRRVKPYCNAVEVSNIERDTPPPKSVEGGGYSAACFALAGRIEDARRAIDGISQGDRARAANIVFEVGHPVADAGDDRSAGPIMELVVDYVPDHYMALYHAGMAEYMLGQHDLSRRNLTRFLEIYRVDDGWRRNAIEILGRLNGPDAAADPRRPREP
jgi:hypothetical protein